jgi:hypothetical protein
MALFFATLVKSSGAGSTSVSILSYFELLASGGNITSPYKNLVETSANLKQSKSPESRNLRLLLHYQCLPSISMCPSTRTNRPRIAHFVLLTT